MLWLLVREGLFRYGGFGVVVGKLIGGQEHINPSIIHTICPLSD